MEQQLSSPSLTTCVPSSSSSSSTRSSTSSPSPPLPLPLPLPLSVATSSSTTANNKRHQTPAFLEKLFDILEDVQHANSSLIAWQPDGNSFIIKKVNEFSETVLPKYFKHSNIQSYIRQLNMYGFSKTRHDSNHHEFTHRLFQRGRRDLLPFIRRKTQQHSTATNAGAAVSTSQASGSAFPDEHNKEKSVMPNDKAILIKQRSREILKRFTGREEVGIADEEFMDNSGDDQPEPLEIRVVQLENQLSMLMEHCWELTTQHNQLCEALQYCHQYHMHHHSANSFGTNSSACAVPNEILDDREGQPLKRMRSHDGSFATGSAEHQHHVQKMKFNNYDFDSYKASFTSLIPFQEEQQHSSGIFDRLQSDVDSNSIAHSDDKAGLGVKLSRKSYSVDLGGLEAIAAAADLLDFSNQRSQKLNSSKAMFAGQPGGPLVKSHSYRL